MADEMDDIWALYADDGTQAMDATEAALLALKAEDPEAQPGLVAALFRAVHTFKGNARVLGLGVVESRAHLAEDLIGLVRDEGVPLTAEIIGLLIETGDTLRGMLEDTAASRADVDPEASQDLMSRLATMIARCKAGEATPPPPDAATSPALEAEPAEPVAVEIVVTPPEDSAPAEAGPRLADDPGYRAIFREIVAEKIARLRDILDRDDPAAATRPLDDLAHAAAQMGLSDWTGALSGCAPLADTAALAALIARLEALAAAEAGPSAAGPATPLDGPGDTPAPSSSAEFFAALAAPLRDLSRMGIDFLIGTEPEPERLARTVESIVLIAEASGYLRFSEHGEALQKARTPADFRLAELRLYEDLASIEMLDAAGGTALADSPSHLLATWCADHIFDALDEMGRTLDAMGRGMMDDRTPQTLERLVRLVHHACRHYGLDIAGQLAMSLLDLFGRGHALGKAPDAILLRIARGFVDTLELVFDALREGEVPDTTRLDALFVEASEAGFSGSGITTATAIERQLGLPAEFHRVLSPDSVRAAAEALAQGQSFHIMRADVNTDDRLAEALFQFIGSGRVRMITNVTVFRGDETLFDFLIATPMEDADLADALARIDPGGRHIMLMRRLEPQGVEPAAGGAEPTAGGSSAVGVELTASILERIGEIAAGQAMVHGMISELADEDLPGRVAEILRRCSEDPEGRRVQLQELAEGFGQRLRDLAQLETQVQGQMAELQQSTSEQRARPVETVLRPLIAEAATEARKAGHDLRLTSAGGDLDFDIALLDNLKRALRPLMRARAAMTEAAPARMHLTVRRADDHLAVTVEDDGGPVTDPAMLQPTRDELTQARGSLRSVALPGGGQRFHLALPISLVVMEGMVVGAGGARYVLPVEAIRTILQPDPGSILCPPAGGGGEWLRLNQDEVISLRRLSGDKGHRSAPPVVVVLGREGESTAVPVDEVIGQQLVLLRPLRGMMARLRGVTGVALLAGGEVGMVLAASNLCGTGEPSGLVGVPVASSA